MSPDGGTKNQIDHVAFSKRWRSSLWDVCIMQGTDFGSDHHLLRWQAKDCQNKEGESGRMHFKVSKLRDLETRIAFKLVLHNRFKVLQQMEEEELSVDDE